MGRLGVAGACAGLLFFAGAGLVCFRRSTKFNAGFGVEKASFAWCALSHLVGANEFFFADYGPDGQPSRPSLELVDLFGSNRISMFLSAGVSENQREHRVLEVSTRDDGFIDLFAEFDGAELVRALRFDSSCLPRKAVDVVAAGRVARKVICSDLETGSSITASEALAILRYLPIVASRRGFVEGHLRGAIELPRTAAP